MNALWIALLFSVLGLWVLLELYAWWKHDKRYPTVSDLLVKYLTPRGLAICTILLCVILLLHWEIIRRDPDWILKFLGR